MATKDAVKTEFITHYEYIRALIIFGDIATPNENFSEKAKLTDVKKMCEDDGLTFNETKYNEYITHYNNFMNTDKPPKSFKAGNSIMYNFAENNDQRYLYDKNYLTNMIAIASSPNKGKAMYLSTMIRFTTIPSPLLIAKIRALCDLYQSTLSPENRSKIIYKKYLDNFTIFPNIEMRHDELRKVTTPLTEMFNKEYKKGNISDDKLNYLYEKQSSLFGEIVSKIQNVEYYLNISSISIMLKHEGNLLTPKFDLSIVIPEYCGLDLLTPLQHMIQNNYYTTVIDYMSKRCNNLRKPITVREISQYISKIRMAEPNYKERCEEYCKILNISYNDVMNYIKKNEVEYKDSDDDNYKSDDTSKSVDKSNKSVDKTNKSVDKTIKKTSKKSKKSSSEESESDNKSNDNDSDDDKSTKKSTKKSKKTSSDDESDDDNINKKKSKKTNKLQKKQEDKYKVKKQINDVPKKYIKKSQFSDDESDYADNIPNIKEIKNLDLTRNKKSKQDQDNNDDNM